jgi:hypothetical protein
VGNDLTGTTMPAPAAPAQSSAIPSQAEQQP